MKGIILAGGSGTHLYPVTHSLSKQLLPVYDKPMIYYPLSILMLAGIQDILIITTPYDQQSFINLLGSGNQWGINLSYESQPSPAGIAQAFIIGEQFIGNDKICLVLGDNIFYGDGMHKLLAKAKSQEKGATVFAYYVKDPERYGVITFNNAGQVIGMEEKPKIPSSNYAVTGLYFYDNDVIEIAKNIKPSPRGELEITDINKTYLQRGDLNVEIMDRSYAWLDTGTPASLMQASNFIHGIEERQGLKIACLEEIAYTQGFIDTLQIKAMAKHLLKSGYGEYLMSLVN